jgi:hypothetical protein
MSLNASKLQSETIVGPSKYFFSKFRTQRHGARQDSNKNKKFKIKI